MLKKISIAASLMVVLMLMVTSTALAVKTKYTFEDVVIDGQIVEIEASVKQNKKGAYSTCSYFADDYTEHLGLYDEAVLAGESEEEVLSFCKAHFEERSP